ncbi:MAG TPA: Smr/MutS family protein [Patescibacteria group bacterium]|nr:Smr/MutS family protein [Patescibacteria group bacterium]
MRRSDSASSRGRISRVFSTGRSTSPPAPACSLAIEPPDDPDDPVSIPIEDAFDLHSFRPADIPSVVEEYLAQAHARGFIEVRLIHGRGIGVQRSIVQSLLALHPLVAHFADAPEDRGGRGATLVRLRQPS